MTSYELYKKFMENLELERMRLGMSQKSMAEKLELSLSAYKRLITLDTAKIDLFMLYKLCLITGRSVNELMGIDDALSDMRAKVLSLSPSQKAFVESVIDFEHDFALHCEDSENYVTVYVPTGNMEDGMIYDSTNVEKINIAEYRNKFGNAISCGIKITSNHLHPVYNLGDVLLISRRPIRDGDTGVFFNKSSNCAYIRKFHQTSPCALEPLNSYGETFYVDSTDKAAMDNWIKFGVVIAKVR